MTTQETKIEKMLLHFNELLTQQKAIADEIKVIKDTLKSVADEKGMKDGEYFMGKTLKSRYDNLWKDKFNSKQLEKDLPDLYNKYIQKEVTHQITVNNPQLI